MNKLMALILTLNSGLAFAAQTPKVERPPQFVMLAFDGSYLNNVWQETRDFAQKIRRDFPNKKNTDGIPALSFTYFISGVYWLQQTNYANYMPPHEEAKFRYNEKDIRDEKERRNKEALKTSLSDDERKRIRFKYSDIGFGIDKNDVIERINQVNMAYEEGHEMASHANGHFKGGKKEEGISKNWSLLQWHSEFQQFFHLIFDAFEINQIRKNPSYGDSGYAFGRQNIVGFRAPLLDTNDEMFQALKDYNFKYDTSGAVSSTVWPRKNKLGTWWFPLAMIDVAGTTHTAPSMDYNFYYVQSKGMPDKENSNYYRDQMYKSYMKYFNDNYYGNRAPIHIGHHFTFWNDNAYWNAMKKFAETVCGKPEVRCVTYTDYMHWLETQGEHKVSLYQNTAFQKLAKPASLKSESVIGKTEPRLEVYGDTVKATFKMDRLSKMLGYQPVIKVNNKIAQGTEVNLQDIRNYVVQGSDAVISAAVINKQGNETNSYSLKLKKVGTSEESISEKSMEEMALVVDMAEAHEHEGH